MKLKKAIAKGFRILFNPSQEFEEINKRTFEEVLEDYIKLLLLSGLLAVVVTFTYILLSAAYLNLFKGIAIDYWRLINYSAGTSGSIFFFYLFAGTFIFFILSLIIKVFVKRVKYTRVVALMFYSLTPVLFFGWLSARIVPPLFIWSAFLLVAGVKKENERANEKEAVREVLRKRKKA
jgi:hypothetical protein